MVDSGHFCLGTRVYIGRRPYDHTCYRQSPNQSGYQVTKTLRLQLPVGRRYPLIGIEIIYRFDAQQALQAGYQRQGYC